MGVVLESGKGDTDDGWAAPDGAVRRMAGGAAGPDGDRRGQDHSAGEKRACRGRFDAHVHCDAREQARARQKENAVGKSFSFASFDLSFPENLKSVAGAGAGIGEALPCFGDELPVIAVRLERELQNAESCGLANFAVGFWFAEGPVVFAASADDKFANAALRIGGAVWSLRGEALVVVVVSGDDNLGVGIVERLEEWLHGEVVAVGSARTEERLVPVGESACGGMRGEVRAQPFFLGRTGLAAAGILAFAIQHDDVPGAQFVAVVSGFRVAGRGAKIVEIR